MSQFPGPLTGGMGVGAVEMACAGAAHAAAPSDARAIAPPARCFRASRRPVGEVSDIDRASGEVGFCRLDRSRATFWVVPMQVRGPTLCF